MGKKRLIIATRSKGKLKEIKTILKGLNYEVVSLEELGKRFRIVENGKTFLENASKKAFVTSKRYKDEYVLGEDSGLEVDYLDNRPGIYSKRYSGKNSNSQKNNRKILKELAGIPFKKRTARFCCCLVLAKSGRVVEVFEGRLKGLIAKQPQGVGGFGYDPIFYLPYYRKTTAQLPLKSKNRISHRGKAFRKFKKYLLEKIG